MIYVIAEFLASLSDCVILILFLIKSLSFKSDKFTYNIFVTIFFVAILQMDILLMNNHFTLEGIFSISYIIILFIYSRILLKHKWIKQMLLVLIGLAVIFCINTLITVISSSILKIDYSALLQMRNIFRVIFLILSKLLLITILYPISVSIRKSDFLLQPIQTIASVLSLLATIVIGIIIENMLLDQALSSFYAMIIMSCLITIDVLLLIVVNQLSKNNISSLNQAVLETRLHDEEKKLQESIQLVNSIRTLRHDLSNHLIAVTRYIHESQYDKAIDYINKLSDNIYNIPLYTQTNNSALNAILDVKRTICIDNKIRLKCYIEEELPEFEPFSFNIIFSNLMDNAIEAEMNQEDKEIRISIDTFSSYLHIIVQNKIDNSILINGNVPTSSKKDKLYHGLGLSSIKDTLAANNGSIEFYEHDKWFIAEVLLPCNPCSN